MEKPILFSTPMVQAILKGRKTQTRRVVKKQILYDDDSGYKFWDNLMFDIHDDVLETMYMPDHCPYGAIGDVLWVRETFAITGSNPIHDSASGILISEKMDYVFRGQKQPHIEKLLKWKPSIYMPKEACRIRLLIKDISVERLQDISDSDALAEGVEHVIDKITGYCGYDYLNGGYNLMTTPYHGYKSLWEKINGKGSWGLNPWVWIIEFEVL